jgi:hypothetical protein
MMPKHTSPGVAEAPEAGVSDNRLSLSVADFPVIEDWEDGQRYKLSDLGDVEIEQVSPGEFTVIAQPVEAEVEEDEAEAASAARRPAPRRATRNPAVAAMIDDEQA